MAVGDMVIQEMNTSGTLITFQPAASVVVLFTCFGRYNQGYPAFYNTNAANNACSVEKSTVHANDMKMFVNNSILL